MVKKYEVVKVDVIGCYEFSLLEVIWYYAELCLLWMQPHGEFTAWLEFQRS